jgi:hypothetical protein
MAFWCSQTLRARIPAEQIIEPYAEGRVIHSAYEMGVGGEAFVTSNPSDKTLVPAGTKIVIPPGQFGLIVTRETSGPRKQAGRLAGCRAERISSPRSVGGERGIQG